MSSSLFHNTNTFIFTGETTIHGHRIPVGSIILYNFRSAHLDPGTFEDPKTFNPSRYMSSPGKPKAESPVIFGMGKIVYITIYLYLHFCSYKNFILKFKECFINHLKDLRSKVNSITYTFMWLSIGTITLKSIIFKLIILWFRTHIKLKWVTNW